MATVASLQNFPGMCKESFPNDWFPGCEEVSTGTTLVALEFDGGVVIGADSRTSMGTWVANRVTDKLTPVTDNIFCCRSTSLQSSHYSPARSHLMGEIQTYSGHI